MYKRNIPLLYFYSCFIKRVSQPIIILYFLLNTLNYTQIGILAAVMSVLTLATEVHGGIFADLKGKKSSLILHSVFGILTMSFYFLGNSFWWYLIASICYGLGGAFISGTRGALMYDSLKEDGRTKLFKKYNGKMIFYSHIFNALVLLVIPVIYTFNVKLPFLIGIGFFLISLGIAWFMKEPHVEHETNKYKEKLFSSYKEIRINKALFWIIIVGVFLQSVLYITTDYKQPLLLLSGLSVIYFGVVYAGMRAFMGVASALTYKLTKYYNHYRLLFLGLLFLVGGFVGLSWGIGWVIPVAIVIMGGVGGFNRVIVDDELNQNIKSQNRTTILSIKSLFSSLLTGFSVLIMGVMADLISVQGMLKIMTFVVLVVGLGVFYYYKKN
jgi:MFS family permease